MRHHLYNPDYDFVKEPADFDQNSDRKLLQFCLGATLYTPGTKDIKKDLVNKDKLIGLTSLVLDCEDAISKSELNTAEENIINILDYLVEAKAENESGNLEVPLIFIRVRNIEHFIQFSQKLSNKHFEVLSGFNFPKFDTNNAQEYLTQLEDLNNKYDSVIYAMPILESRELAYSEKRIQNLKTLKNILAPYKKLILNIRVGGADFSSLFSLRRGADFTIYDLAPVKECLTNIINLFNRAEDYYILSGPVWEYFSAANSSNLSKKQVNHFYSKLLNHENFINKSIDGLLRETIMDQLNGFIGKTIIHPSQIRYVNALQAVTEEEYLDAKQIIGSESEGVLKSLSGNKMNEINPHHSWAEKIICKAEAYGVIKDRSEYPNLIFGKKGQN